MRARSSRSLVGESVSRFNWPQVGGSYAVRGKKRRGDQIRGGAIPLHVAAYNFRSLARANTSSWNFPHAHATDPEVNGIRAPSAVAGQPDGFESRPSFTVPPLVQQISALPAGEHVEARRAAAGADRRAGERHGHLRDGIELVGLGAVPERSEGRPFRAVPPLHQEVAAGASRPRSRSIARRTLWPRWAGARGSRRRPPWRAARAIRTRRTPFRPKGCAGGRRTRPGRRRPSCPAEAAARDGALVRPIGTPTGRTTRQASRCDCEPAPLRASERAVEQFAFGPARDELDLPWARRAGADRPVDRDGGAAVPRERHPERGGRLGTRRAHLRSGAVRLPGRGRRPSRGARRWRRRRARRRSPRSRTSAGDSPLRR